MKLIYVLEQLLPVPVPFLPLVPPSNFFCRLQATLEQQHPCLGLNVLDDVVPIAAGKGAVQAPPVRTHPLVLGVNLRVQHGLQEGRGCEGRGIRK